jgi:hypothetical protein
MRLNPGLLYNFCFSHGIAGAVDRPVPAGKANLKRSDEPKQAMNIGIVQPEIQGIARNFAPRRLIRRLRQRGGAPSRKD